MGESIIASDVGKCGDRRGLGEAWKEWTENGPRCSLPPEETIGVEAWEYC